MRDSVFIPTQTDVSDILRRIEEDKYKDVIKEVEIQKAKMCSKEDKEVKKQVLYHRYLVEESYDLDLSILELSQDYFKELKTGFYNQYCYYGAVQSIKAYIDRGWEPPSELWMWVCQARNAYLSKYQVVQHSR